MRSFMVAFENLDQSGEVSLRDLLGEHGYKFWHRFPNVWIVITPDEVDALKLQLSISEHLFGAINILVVEFEGPKLVGRISLTQTEWFAKNLGLAHSPVKVNTGVR